MTSMDELNLKVSSKGYISSFTGLKDWYIISPFFLYYGYDRQHDSQCKKNIYKQKEQQK